MTITQAWDAADQVRTALALHTGRHMCPEAGGNGVQEHDTDSEAILPPCPAYFALKFALPVLERVVAAEEASRRAGEAAEAMFADGSA